jgi:tRNA dimethylallyltransferase
VGSRERPAPPLIGVVGPTASGKTDLALALAREMPVEILIADSRQVYRGMDVGTAKPDARARAAVPHHLLDLADPDEPFTVAQWVRAARQVLPEVAARGRLPTLVGGTGLYVSAIVDGHDYESQAWSPEVRAELTARLAVEGLDALAAELLARDPERAATIDLRNSRRVLRALERATVGGAAEAWRAAPYPGRVALIGLSRPRDVLYRRIDERARRLFVADGLPDEVSGLMARGFGAHLRPMTGHGYREAARLLAGEWSVDEAIAMTARRTRQYAKRQLTWFRRDARILWIQAGDRPADDRRTVDEASRLLRAALS